MSHLAFRFLFLYVMFCSFFPTPLISGLQSSYTDLPTRQHRQTFETCCSHCSFSVWLRQQVLISFVPLGTGLPPTVCTATPDPLQGFFSPYWISHSSLRQMQWRPVSRGTWDFVAVASWHPCPCPYLVAAHPMGFYSSFQVTRRSAALTCLTHWKLLFKGWESP